MWIHNLNPTLFSLGPLEIRWYGIVYVLGFFLGGYWLQHLRKKGMFPLSKEEIWDFTFYLMVGLLIGARLFMVIWRPDVYLVNPLELLKIWQGGMSFHGGLVGMIVAAYWYCRKKGVNFWTIADAASFPAILALAFGRIANFINGELVGRKFDGSWCVVFPYDEGCRHPSTLYAALKRFLVAGWVYVLALRTFKPGFIFWNFVFFEGLGRFIVDFYREDILYLGLSTGQWMSLIMVFVAFWAFLKFYKNEWKSLLKRRK